MSERESGCKMEMEKGKTKVRSLYHVIIIKKITWSILSIRHFSQVSSICPLVTTIFASSSAINYMDIINSKLFLRITTKLVLHLHPYYSTTIFFSI